jgi:hypothetical protein
MSDLNALFLIGFRVDGCARMAAGIFHFSTPRAADHGIAPLICPYKDVKFFRGAVGEIEMNVDPKSQPRPDSYADAKRARKRQEDALDDALENTFPASDPISVEQPAPRADRDKAKS